MSKDTATTLSNQLTQVTKALDAEIANADKNKTPKYELTALKTWRGIVGRVATDLSEMGK